jgi:hypothetical protein
MAGKVFMRIDTASFKCVIVRWEVRFAPRTMMIVIMAISSAARTAAESTAGSQSVFLAVRHVAAAASKSREVVTQCCTRLMTMRHGSTFRWSSATPTTQRASCGLPAALCSRRGLTTGD